MSEHGEQTQAPPADALMVEFAAIRADLAALRTEVAALRREAAETGQVTDGLSMLVTLLAGQMQRLADRQQG